MKHTRHHSAIFSVDAMDQIFKRDDIRGLWPETLNSEVAFLLGEALYELLLRRALPGSVALGHDARKGSYDLSLAFLRGFKRRGGKAQFLGLVSSEQLYYACGRYAELYSAGVMITASHNPKEFNGMKFIHGGALPYSRDDLEELKKSLKEKLDPPEILPIAEEFADHLLELSGWSGKAASRPAVKAVIAAGNGVGAVAFAPLAEKLQAKGLSFSFLDPEPDGDFPYGVSNPLLKEQVERLGNEVRRHKADLGIIFDGDADRAGFVDCDGKEIIPSQVFALVAQQKLAQNRLKNPLFMRNLCCSQLLVDLFKGSAVELLDTPVGHGQIKQLMRHHKFRERVLFAGEHSGHYFYPEFFSVDSGFLTALTLLAKTSQLKQQRTGLPQILEAWRKTYQWSGEINFLMPSQDAVNNALVEIERKFSSCPGILRQGIELDPELGLYRVVDLTGKYQPGESAFPDLKIIRQSPDSHSGWWLVLRPSGNESKLRLNFESWNMDKGQADKIMQEISSSLTRHHAQKTT